MDKHWISLCKVNRPDKNRDIWMLRLADAVGGVLVAPYFDKQKEQIHDNRLFVFCDDGPTEPGRIGFWEWEEFESEPGRWKTTSTYMEQASPVEVIVLDEVSNIEGVIMSLKSGLKIPSYAHGKIIFAAKNDTGFEGVLCDTGESLLRQRNPELVALRDDIYTLPYYKLSKSDIFEWKYEWESRKIYKYISLREPQKRIPIYPISETIKNIFLSSMGWPIFKAQAILKNDYLKFREALASIPKESILERVADTYGISIQEAQTYVDEFLQMVEKYMTVEDVDSAVITRILSKHGGLWQKCNDIAYNKWIADHANEVNTAQEELAALQHKVAQAENDVSSAKEKHGDILREVAEAQDDLCRLQAEIARYKILEKETVAAIREKIAGAQKNVAGFIADLSILLPQATSNESGWKYRHMLAIAPLARSGSGSVLFPARMHMLFRGIKGVYACTNPECSCAHTENGLTLGEVYFTDGNLTCKKCGSTVYELYNDRRCGSIFFRGFVLKQDFDDRKRTYLWHYPGMMNENEVQEILLFVPSADYQLPEKQGKNKIQPCYLDVCSGFVDFSDDSLDGSPGIRKLYYGEFTTKARPDILTFSTCPHCRHELGKRQLTSFSTRGNQSFFNLIKAQFAAQPAVPEKVGEPDRLPNEGRKILLFSDSRQRAAKLARDMSDASDATVARQLAAIAIDRMEHEVSEQSMNYIYDYFAMVAVEHHVQIFHDSENEKQRERLVEHGSIASKNYKRAKSRRQEYHPRFSIDNAPTQMKEQLLHFYCGGYNTLIDSAISWIEPTDEAKWNAIDALEDAGIDASEEEFMELFNAWILSTCDNAVILGHTIKDTTREKVRPNYVGYGVTKDSKFSTSIRKIMGWSDNDPISAKWNRILRKTFMDEGSESNGKYYIDLSRVKPRFDLSHTWFRCEHCSELTPYMLLNFGSFTQLSPSSTFPS